MSEYQNYSEGQILKDFKFKDIKFLIYEDLDEVRVFIKLHEAEREIFEEKDVFALIECPDTRFRHYLTIKENEALDYEFPILFQRILHESRISIVSFDKDKQMKFHSAIYKFNIDKIQDLNITFRWVSFKGDSPENKCKASSDLFWYMECRSANNIVVHLNSDIQDFQKIMTIGINTISGISLMTIIKTGIRAMFRFSIEYELVNFSKGNDLYEDFLDNFSESLGSNNTYMSQYSEKITENANFKKKTMFPWISSDSNPWLFYSDYLQRPILLSMNQIIQKGVVKN